MKRATACALFLVMGSIAIAADEGGLDDKANTDKVEASEVDPDAIDEAALPPIEEPPEDLRPVRGVRYKLVLKSGRNIRGIVRSSNVFERWSTAGGYEEAEFEHKDAGIRLWFPGKQDGFIFVKVKEIETLSEQGELTDAEGLKLARRQFHAAQVAKRERERQRLTLLRLASKRASAEAGGVGSGDAEDAGLSKKQEALLLKYPPGDWTPETPDEISRRRTVLGLFPSKTEKAFLEVFDAWNAAYDLWKAAKAKQGEAGEDGEGADAK